MSFHTIRTFVPTIAKVDDEFLFFCDDCESQVLEVQEHIALHEAAR